MELVTYKCQVILDMYSLYAVCSHVRTYVCTCIVRPCGWCMHACFLAYVRTCSTFMIDLKLTALEPHIMLLYRSYLMVAVCHDGMHVYYSTYILNAEHVHIQTQAGVVYTTNVTAHHLCD